MFNNIFTLQTPHAATLMGSICCVLLSSCASNKKADDAYVVSISAAESMEAKKETNGKQELLQLMNETRRKKGRKPLTIDSRLSRAAQLHSQEMNSRGIMSHTGKDGSNFDTRILRQGYPVSFSAENLARAPSAHWVNKMWIASPSHNKNLYGKSYTQVGIGKAGKYWTAVYAEAKGGKSIANSTGRSQTLPPPAISYAGGF